MNQSAIERIIAGPELEAMSWAVRQPAFLLTLLNRGAEAAKKEQRTWLASCPKPSLLDKRGRRIWCEERGLIQERPDRRKES